MKKKTEDYKKVKKYLEKKIDKLFLRMAEDRDNAECSMLYYLDSCNIKLKNGYTNYYDEDVPLKEIKGKKSLIITEDGEQIDYRDMNFEELTDLYNVVKSYNKK